MAIFKDSEPQSINTRNLAVQFKSTIVIFERKKDVGLILRYYLNKLATTSTDETSALNSTETWK